MVASSNAKTNTESMKNSDKNDVSNPLDTVTISIKSQNDAVPNNLFSPEFEITSNGFQPTWVEKLPVVSPEARQHSAMAFDSLNDKVIIFGGANGTVLGDTWAYDYSSNTWENMNPIVSPTPQQGHAMVYDPSIQKVVLFGSGAQTWTYQYSINTWEQQTPQVSPSPRLYFSLVYDTTRQKVIMMGGNTGTFETWEMDSTSFNWTNLSPITPLPQLFAFASSYDQANDKIIVFGGQNTTSLAINDGETYAYDYPSNEWTLLNPLIDPSDRRFYGRPMGYNVQAEKSAFFGGITNGGNSDETWTFDYSTTSWELIPTTGTPSARWIHTMVFNSKVNKFVMFGGTDGARSDQTFVLSVIDVDPPVIISSGDKFLELGAVSSAISWQLMDPSNGIYEIKLDDQTVDTGNFVDGQIISLVPYGLDLGNYILKMTATDLEGNSASDTLMLFVVEVEPPIIIGPDDLEIEFFEFNKNITWILEDLTPANYNVTQNGTLIDGGEWANGDTVVVNLDPLPLGSHVFEITVTDVYDNVATDTVLIRIYDGNVPFISSPNDIFSTEGTIGNKIVWEVDDDNPTIYVLERNGEVIGYDSYLNIFFIEVNLDGYTFGTYNFNLTLYDENNQSVSDYVEVQIFPINEGAGNTVTPRSGGGGGGNFIQNVDPQLALGAGAFVAVFGGAYFIIRRRSSSF
ncbi:MAG: Kelch repeat-containing protein, partial [Candidatus Heimdallarchaeota archaeon]